MKGDAFCGSEQSTRIDAQLRKSFDFPADFDGAYLEKQHKKITAELWNVAVIFYLVQTTVFNGLHGVLFAQGSFYILIITSEPFVCKFHRIPKRTHSPQISATFRSTLVIFRIFFSL